MAKKKQYDKLQPAALQRAVNYYRFMDAHPSVIPGMPTVLLCFAAMNAMMEIQAIS